MQFHLTATVSFNWVSLSHDTERYPPAEQEVPHREYGTTGTYHQRPQSYFPRRSVPHRQVQQSIGFRIPVSDLES